MKKVVATHYDDRERIALIHRLNRIQGQIDGIRRALESNERNSCLSNIGQIKAVHAAIKRFAGAYVDTYAIACAQKEGVSPKFEKDIRTIVASAFLI